MMNRLNAEAPKYYEGYLTNGKPITEANIKEMLAEAEKGMPDGTKWDESSFYNYGTRAFGNYMTHTLVVRFQARCLTTCLARMLP